MDYEIKKKQHLEELERVALRAKEEEEGEEEEDKPVLRPTTPMKKKKSVNGPPGTFEPDETSHNLPSEMESRPKIPRTPAGNSFQDSMSQFQNSKNAGELDPDSRPIEPMDEQKMVEEYEMKENKEEKKGMDPTETARQAFLS